MRLGSAYSEKNILEQEIASPCVIRFCFDIILSGD